MTKELIERARDWLKRGPVAGNGTEIMRGLADALETATRVPVQGEPNACLDHKPVQHRDGKPPWCNTCGRATVPDAATDDMSVPEFCEALGFVDGSTTPARLRDIVEPIQWWDSEARDHVECARICELCGETLARTLCGECLGGGQRDGGNGTVRECGNCGGAGWLHEGCAEVSYADLVAERDAAVAAVERVRAIHIRDTPSIGGDWCLDDHHKWPCPTVAALDGAPEPEEKP